MDLKEYFTENLYPWVIGMPDEMVEQMQNNVTELVGCLPETPEALEAAHQTAQFNFRIARGFADQIGGEAIDDTNDGLWQVIASMAVQNVAVMLRIAQIRDPTNEGDE